MLIARVRIFSGFTESVCVLEMVKRGNHLVRNGKGLLSWRDGRCYHGMFQEDMAHGVVRSIPAKPFCPCAAALCSLRSCVNIPDPRTQIPPSREQPPPPQPLARGPGSSS